MRRVENLPVFQVVPENLSMRRLRSVLSDEGKK
jgi:hypothetical protein